MLSYISRNIISQTQEVTIPFFSLWVNCSLGIVSSELQNLRIHSRSLKGIKELETKPYEERAKELGAFSKCNEEKI